MDTEQQVCVLNALVTSTSDGSLCRAPGEVLYGIYLVLFGHGENLRQSCSTRRSFPKP